MAKAKSKSKPKVWDGLIGKKREVVEQMIQGLEKADKQDLLPLGYAFSALVFKREDDREWLRKRFFIMHDILEESWAYQEMVQKGLAKGVAQGLEIGMEKGMEKGVAQGSVQALRATLIRFVELRFPELVSLAKQVVEREVSLEQIQVKLDRLYPANTIEAARTALLEGGN